MGMVFDHSIPIIYDKSKKYSTYAVGLMRKKTEND